ncbi:hypothetical protein I3842_02G026500 [Carya illinoinensis]|uniref:Uncharacterized protein n=1 Tax=Carya illinoinensis TaxID=32201 RepID=A0A922FRJ9_CARIL|nr:hypothetical protein I3842_02G026500 [Carya illinoinensis]
MQAKEVAPMQVVLHSVESESVAEEGCHLSPLPAIDTDNAGEMVSSLAKVLHGTDNAGELFSSPARVPQDTDNAGELFSPPAKVPQDTDNAGEMFSSPAKVPQDTEHADMPPPVLGSTSSLVIFA